MAKPLGMLTSSSINISSNILFVGWAGLLSLLLISANDGPSKRMKAESRSSSIGGAWSFPLGLIRELRYGRGNCAKRLRIIFKELSMGIIARRVSPRILSKQKIRSAAIKAIRIESWPMDTIS